MSAWLVGLATPTNAFVAVSAALILAALAVVIGWGRSSPADAVDEHAETAMAALTPDALDDVPVSRQLQRLDCSPDACLASRQAHRREAVPLSDAQAIAWARICRDLEGISR